MAGLWSWGIDYQGQPLLDAWWTPGWTSQNRDGSSVQVPQNNFLAAGFPSGLNYVTVTGNYFDTSSDPISGYFTFWPSDSLMFTVNNVITIMPRRFAGVNQSLLGINQMGDGKIFLRLGQLSVNLLATDNANMQPASFTYHVKEYTLNGMQYDISVPSANAPATDIHNLIIPGTIRPVNDDDDDFCRNDRLRILPTESRFVVADITGLLPTGVEAPLSSYPVSFAFVSGMGTPSVTTTWTQGSWVTTSEPFICQCLVGPNGVVLPEGSYRIWVQVTAGLQLPQVPVGFLDIY